ncbi:hypothetical protein N5I15_01245 [Acinetobacter johnsonii]|uniref:hypothetical protein n=1 Tax=Acinetobacter johnsonii TaxID=40214 RepID=UPI00244C5001|nr:hypothetical protein [Acinetobacter johnsonii]MDH1531029.1 hypothetical protein [Acinetobacter johnsonii]
MDIQETIDIRYEEIEGLKQKLSEDHYMNPEQEDELEELIAQAIKFGELCAKRDAKAQAVPEGFVLVKKELPEQIAEKMAIDRIDKPRHENDPVWREIAEQSYKDQVKSKKWEFWRDYKAMIEAQEPTND